jgi:hypothetical protein
MGSDYENIFFHEALDQIIRQPSTLAYKVIHDFSVRSLYKIRIQLSSGGERWKTI